VPQRYVVIGAGIVGLATAHRILRDRPGARVTVVEKEPRVAAHQTGHNSGVIHSGVYYPPGSLKARLCRAGSASMLRFCTEHEIPVRLCGKLIVASDEAELPRLTVLHRRGLANGLAVRLLDGAEAREYEPHVSCVAALRVASTGVVDFARVAARLADEVRANGGELRLGEAVSAIAPDGAGTVVCTPGAELRADVLVNCAGGYADRVARMAGVDPGARIIPFRGEYHELRPERRYLVQALIYPVPDPRFPFLGVHLTRTVADAVHAGPNAVLALSREGYAWRRVRPRDVLEAAGYPGLWRLARGNLRYALSEVVRSLSPQRFAASVARLVPEIGESDLVRAGSGVRAQAVTRAGALVDDFLVVTGERQVHVINAPSPAATSALEIARHIVDRLPA
jgi:(S)-2-hydroxyglutarate dehydrogenase